MRILYITNNSVNDFLSDAVFQGLKSLDSIEIFELNPLWYMYNTVDKKSLVKKFHGRGFTYYAELPYTLQPKIDFIQAIKNRYFNAIVYGNVRRSLDLLDIVFQYYKNTEIIFLDGNDEHNQPGIHTDFISRGIYFRRELSIEENRSYPSVKPINFAFPKFKMPEVIPQKEKVLATVIPGISNTFIFDDEASYLEDYRSSLFAYTWRKAGWDCLRHYEILGSDCIPLFLDIEHCPDTICTTIPKKILIEYYKLSGIYKMFEMDGEIIYDEKRSIIINRDLRKINDIEITQDFMNLYEKFLHILKEYNKNYITTEALAKYVLNEIDIQNI